MARALALGVLGRTLTRGWRSGFISGLGVATGDASSAALAAFGVAAVTNLLVAERRWIGLAGGIGLIAIGVRTIVGRGTPSLTLRTRGREISSARGVAGSYFSTLALTLSNPPTILSFTAIFAGFGLRVGRGWLPAVGLVLIAFGGLAAVSAR
jgi:threonine/homoserine/homoserine lactone efflux protein